MGRTLKNEGMFRLKSLEGKNRGIFHPDPGTVKTERCGICTEKMNVERNTLMLARFSKKKRRVDYFICPNNQMGWHERILELVWEAERSASARIRTIIEAEITEILRTRTVPDL